MPLGRRPVWLVALAAFVLLVTTVCPRGMLRAVAVSETDRTVAQAGVVLDDAPDPGEDRLPGVRVSIAREEETSEGSVIGDLLAATMLGAVDDKPVERPARAVIEQPEPCADAPSARPCGDRAPPASM